MPEALKSTLRYSTDSKTSARMRRIPRTNTAPEKFVGAALRAKNIHYRRTNKDLPGNPDFANRSKRWAIFVNGCFWHHHSGCSKASVPNRNTKLWEAKFARNRLRDARSIRQLRSNGYFVAIIWECEVDRIERLVGKLESR